MINVDTFVVCWHVLQASRDSIQFRTVRLSLYDVDKRRVRHSLGHVILPLYGYDVEAGLVIWRDLESDDCLVCGLCYE